MPIIPAVRELKQENYTFKASLGCIGRSNPNSSKIKGKNARIIVRKTVF